MHVMWSDSVNSHLWLNSSYYNDSEPTSISLSNQVPSGTVTAKPTKPKLSTDKPFSYHDVVGIRKGNLYGYYAIITETGDLSEKDAKGYLCYKTITSQNMPSKAQVKNFLFRRKVSFHF